MTQPNFDYDADEESLSLEALLPAGAIVSTMGGVITPRNGVVDPEEQVLQTSKGSVATVEDDGETLNLA